MIVTTEGSITVVITIPASDIGSIATTNNTHLITTHKGFQTIYVNPVFNTPKGGATVATFFDVSVEPEVTTVTVHIATNEDLDVNTTGIVEIGRGAVNRVTSTDTLNII